GPGAPGATAAGGPPGPPPLRRSRRAKVISGVCGGLGRRYDMDPLIFRVVLAVLAIAGGVGLIAYGFAWLLLPLDGEDENELRRLLSGRVEGPALTAVLFALVGCGLLLSMLNNGTVLFFAVMLSASVAGACHWSLHKRRAEQEGAAVDAGTAQTVSVAPPEATAPPVPGGPSWWRDPIVKDGTTGPTGTGYLWGPDDGPYDKREAAATRARRARPRVWVGGWTFLAATLAGAAGVLASWGSQPLGTSVQTGLSCALAVFGLGLVVAAWFGRAGGGTVFAAVLTCALLVGAGAVPRSVSTDWVHTQWRPASATAVRDGYQVGSGIGELDLSRLALKKGRTVSTRASVGAGELTVLVPEDAALELTIEVGLGDIRLPGEREDDIDVSPGARRSVTLGPAGGGMAAGTLRLELEAGLGRVEVQRAHTEP
ncbi:MAG TPA: hypothetical protein DEQ61_09675, partial [Streptomyces sp.]|nr:hypothetical protein [Streptomyces sp.]